MALNVDESATAPARASKRALAPCIASRSGPSAAKRTDSSQEGQYCRRDRSR